MAKPAIGQTTPPAAPAGAATVSGGAAAGVTTHSAAGPLAPVHPASADTLAGGGRGGDAPSAASHLAGADTISGGRYMPSAWAAETDPVAAARPPAPTGAAAAPRDASGEYTADERTAVGQAIADARTGTIPTIHPLAVPAAGPRPAPLPPVQPFGTRGDTRPATAEYAPEFNRRYTMDVLVKHPNSEVRQRAEEAQAALHHGAADAGIKMRAAIDVARKAEATR